MIFGAISLLIRDYPAWSNLIEIPVPEVPSKYNGEVEIGGKGGAHWKVDGQTYYHEQYRDSWELCRQTFYEGGKLTWQDETEQNGPWLQVGVVPGDMFDAHMHGWTDFRKQLSVLNVQSNNDEIRRGITRWPMIEIGVTLSGIAVMLLATAIPVDG